MKKRLGLVSNSSSSSFVLYDKIYRDTFIADIKAIWQRLHRENSEEVCAENLDDISFFISPKHMDKFDAHIAISAAYADECWSSQEKIATPYWGQNPLIEFFYRVKIFFSPSYLQEAMKAEVFGTSRENQVPYLVLEALKEKYGKKLTIHHLG